MELSSAKQIEYFDQRIKDWAASLPGSHENGHFLPNDQVYWSPLSKPLSECVVGIVSSAGIHTHEHRPGQRGLDRLREFAEAGRIRGVAPTHYGIMGFCPPVERMRDEVGAAIASRMHDESVDAALLVAG